MSKPHKRWSKQRRFDAAVLRVLDDGWTQVEAAKEYDVSRQHLNKKVKETRLEREVRVDEAKAKIKISPLGLNEERRVGTFEEFDQRYFGHWICPDCDKHHDMPDFHRDMAEACQGDYNRVVINLPPYHSKSTNVTVKDTIYSLVKNPNLRTLIVSKSLPFARTFLYSMNELLCNPDLYEGAAGNLIDDWGPFKPEGSQAVWNQEQIYVAGRMTAEKDPTVQVLGVGAQIYGRRADVIKFDDVATLDNQRNPERVQDMLEWMDKEALSRIGKKGKAIWVGTRVSPGDVYSTLANRPAYKVLRYSCITDDNNEEVLWGDHFPYEQAIIHRSEMRPADFQLVYQNVDIPGLGASFTQEMLDECKDSSRTIGHYQSDWRLIAGLDPAGGNKDSGYTAFSLVGVDLRTGKRYLVDQVAVKSMKAPQMKDQIIAWTEKYPLFEWRVENNGLQSQLVQYNTEIIQYLAKKGVRVVPHTTHKNKWDPQFGVESIAPLMTAEMFSIPWGNAPTCKMFQPCIEEFVAFPMGMVSDRVMSTWFADLGCRDLLSRAHLPMFNERMKVPNRIRRRRHVVDFQNQEARRVNLADQRGGHMSRGQWGYRRQTLGTPQAHEAVEEYDEDKGPKFVNVEGHVSDK
tara:strand:+ start:977 stop:2863 length:1887 start_codon:yes stop_codon:yes gene_type:complete